MHSCGKKKEVISKTPHYNVVLIAVAIAMRPKKIYRSYHATLDSNSFCNRTTFKEFHRRFAFLKNHSDCVPEAFLGLNKSATGSSTLVRHPKLEGQGSDDDN